MKRSEGYIHLADASIYYQEAGQGLPVIMIHCGTLDHRIWDGQFGEFSRSLRAIRYDCRNHGLSRGAAVSGSHCHDLHQMLESLEIREAVLMGLAMGAGIAMDLALRDPKKVASLILVSPGFSNYQKKDSNLKHCQKVYREALGRGDREGMVECFQRSWTDGPYRSARQIAAPLRAKVHSMAMETVSRWQEGSLELCNGDRLLKEAPGIRQRVLLVAGNLDAPGILDTADFLSHRIKNSQKEVMPHVGHLANMEEPERFNQITLDFIKKIQVQGGKNEIC